MQRQGTARAVLGLTTLLLLLAACGGGGTDGATRLESSPQQSPAAGLRDSNVQPEADTGALARDGISQEGLPPLPEPLRRASRTELIVPGKNALQKSPGSSVSGERLIVEAPAEGIAWAIYDFTTSAEGEYAVELKSSIGDNPDQHYLAIADYSRNRWRWVGPYDSAGSYQIPQDGEYIHNGHVYAAVLTSNGARVVFDELQLQLSQNPPPPPPAGLKAVLQDGAVHLSWDKVDSPGVLGYNIYFAEQNFSQAGESTVTRYNLSLIAAAEQPQHDLTELNPNKQYYFGVATLAADQVESSMSKVVSLHTDFAVTITNVMFEHSYRGYWVFVEGQGFDPAAGATSVLLNGAQSISGENLQVVNGQLLRFRVPWDAPEDSTSQIRVKVFSQLSDSHPLTVFNPGVPLKNWSQIGKTLYQEWQSYDPTGVAVDKNGRYWVGNENARRLDGFNADGTPYDSVFISNIADIEAAPDGRIWIKHGDNEEIWAYNPADKSLQPAMDFQLIADHFGQGDHFALGPANSVVFSDEANGRLARFKNGAFDKYIGSGTLSDPEDVEFDSQGRIVVADPGNDRIYWFDATGALLGSYDGSFDNQDDSGELRDPFALALLPGDFVCCADVNRDRILRLDPASFGFISEWGGSGYMDGSGDSLDPPLGQAGRFWSMWGMCSDADGKLVISDRYNQRTAIYDAGDGTVLGGLGDLVPKGGEWAMPRHVSIRHDTGDYLVLDEAAYCITRMSRRNEFLDRLYLETDGNDGDLITGRMGRTAYACAWGEDNKLYFTHDYTVLTEYTDDFASYRVLATDWGAENGKFKGDYSTAWWDAELFVLDRDNDRVQVFADGFYSRQLAMPDPATNGPNRLAVDGYQGFLYVLSNPWSQDVEVLRFNLATGAYLDKLESPGTESWGDALAVDAAGYVYIYGGSMMFSKYATPATPEGEYKLVASFGNWGDGDGQVRDVSDIQMGPEGRFFVCDDERRQLVILAP